MTQLLDFASKFSSIIPSDFNLIKAISWLTLKAVCILATSNPFQKTNKYKGEINSEDYRTLYISEYIEFLRLKLIDVTNSLVNEITGVAEDENEFIIRTLINFLDKTNPTLYNEKVNAIKNFNTISRMDVSKTIEDYKEMLNDYMQSAERDMNKER